MTIYICYIPHIHTDAMTKTHAMTKKQKDFFINIFTSHFICKSTKGLFRGLCGRGSWRPNITEIFWPQSYGRQRCVFLLWTPIQSGLPRAPSAGCSFPYHHSSISISTWLELYSTVLCSIRRPYITFKLPHGDMDTPPRLCNFFRYLAIGMCQFRYLWNALSDRHRAEITDMQFIGHSLPVHQSMSVPWEFFTSSHFISQFPPMRFPLITAIGMCHFLPLHHLEWHFGPGQKVKI